LLSIKILILIIYFPKGEEHNLSVHDILDSSVQKHLIEKRYEIIWNKTVNENKKYGPIRIGYVLKRRQGERIYSVDGHSITLTASGGGPGRSTGLYCVDKSKNIIRRLSVNECRKLSGFNNDFIVNKNKRVAYKQFGNTIVVPVVEAIIKNLVLQTKEENWSD